MVALVEWEGTEIVLLFILTPWTTRGVVGHRITAPVIILLTTAAVMKVLLITVVIGTVAPQVAGTMTPIAVVIARGAVLLNAAETTLLTVDTMRTAIMVATARLSSTVLLTMVMKLVTAAMFPATVEQCMTLDLMTAAWDLLQPLRTYLMSK